MGAVKFRTVRKPKPGDRATHLGGRLDSRRVLRVEGDELWLENVSGAEMGPFHVANYSYRREVSS